MSAPAKYLFDADFGSTPKPKPAEPTIAVAAHEAALAQAQARAHQAGLAAGIAEADRRGASTLAVMASRLEALAAGMAAIEGRLESEAVEVALAISRKLCPDLMAREPLAELSAMIADCFRQLIGTPHVVVHVAESVHASVREPLEALAKQSGFDGRLVILGEPGIRLGDCKIEWADGGVTRDAGRIETAIAEAVDRYVRARRDPARDAG